MNSKPTSTVLYDIQNRNITIFIFLILKSRILSRANKKYINSQCSEDNYKAKVLFPTIHRFIPKIRCIRIRLYEVIVNVATTIIPNDLIKYNVTFPNKSAQLFPIWVD